MHDYDYDWNIIPIQCCLFSKRKSIHFWSLNSKDLLSRLKNSKLSNFPENLQFICLCFGR